MPQYIIWHSIRFSSPLISSTRLQYFEPMTESLSKHNRILCQLNGDLWKVTQLFGCNIFHVTNKETKKNTCCKRKLSFYTNMHACVCLVHFWKCNYTLLSSFQCIPIVNRSNYSLNNIYFQMSHWGGLICPREKDFLLRLQNVELKLLDWCWLSY